MWTESTRSSLEFIKEFSKNKDDLYIEESCIDIWAKIHGMVGLLRKLEVVCEVLC